MSKNKPNLKNSTKSVMDKFFTTPPKETENTIVENSTNSTLNNNISNVIKHTHVTKVTNKSKHYDERGKRGERYGLLLDNKLKEDLIKLSNAYGSRSVNDFIVTTLIEYVDKYENQQLLKAYENLHKPKN